MRQGVLQSRGGAPRLSLSQRGHAVPPYYPVFLDLRGRRCVVIGGGPIGEEKVERLVDFGADVVVFSPKVTRAVRAMAEEGRLAWHSRRYRNGDLEGAFIAIVADNRDSDLNEEASREAAARNVPLNVNDVTHLCTWIAPSMVRNGDVIIAASTGGTSPALARKLREELAGTSRTGSRYRPIEYGDLAPLLSEVRTELLGRGIRPKPDHWQASITEDLMDMVRSGAVERARETLLSNLMIGADCDCPGRTCRMWEELAASSPSTGED